MGCNESKGDSDAGRGFEKKKSMKEEVIMEIAGCKVHVMEGGEAFEVGEGHLTIMKMMEDNVAVATIIRVGNNVKWPLTKDEPVVKVDDLHYLFSLPQLLISYGVTFPEQWKGVSLLDTFLKDHSCFSCLESHSSKSELDWRHFAPRVQHYNHFLARAIAEGTGHLVKGIFICSNAYTNQVQKGGEAILKSTPQRNNGGMVRESMNNWSDATNTKNSAMNENLKRVRKLTNMTEKLTKSLLDGVGIMSASVMTPVLKSQAGQAFLNMLPGEVLLASLDAVNRVFEAAEAAEKQTFSATSQAATRMVSNRFGEEAGEATEHVFATAGHAVNATWNVSKIRKAINPASSANTIGALRNSAKNRNVLY